MVGRAADHRRVLPTDTLRALAGKLEELRKAVARGAPALRTPGGATLALRSRSPTSVHLVPRTEDGSEGATAITLDSSGGRCVEADGPLLRPWVAEQFSDAVGPLRSTSERAQKIHEADIGGAAALAVVRQWRPALWRWRQGEHPHPDVLRAGCYVDEVDDSTDGAAVAGVDGRGHRAPDPLAMIAYLAAAVVELADLVEARLPPPT